MRKPTRREILAALAGAPMVAAGCASGAPDGRSSASEGAQTPTGTATPHPGPGALRDLGKTGAKVEMFSLGGEGVLRTKGREREAVPMIVEALRLGVRYCDTAPAYASSQDYYGMAFKEVGAGARDKVFLATKTHERVRDAALALLDDSLRRLGTDHVDLWQLHDLRSNDDLDTIFAKGGVIEAVEKAKADGRIRFVGITGHHAPGVLVAAMQRYPFDTVLAAMNPADPSRSPFLTSVIPEAKKRNMGVIGMKALAVGRLVADGVATADELIRYAAGFADTVIVGCKTPEEVRRNVAIARSGGPLDVAAMRSLEARVAPNASLYDTFKA